MSSADSSLPPSNVGQARLRVDLARSGRVLRAAGLAVRHLVSNEDSELFGEEVVARTRGMIEALATELLSFAGEDGPTSHSRALTSGLIDLPDLLAHCHATALEGRIADRLSEAGHDSVVPPLLRAKRGHDEAGEAGLYDRLIAAQARFLARQHRMEIVAAELPVELLHQSIARTLDVVGPSAHSGMAQVRSTFDEARTRLGLLAQVGLSLGDDFLLALDPSQAGLALFATALSLATGHERDQILLACATGQHPRLAMYLARAGLSAAQREAALICFDPEVSLEREWLEVDAQTAAELLDSERAA